MKPAEDGGMYAADVCDESEFVDDWRAGWEVAALPDAGACIGDHERGIGGVLTVLLVVVSA